VLEQKFFWVGHYLMAMTSIRMQGMLSACMLDGGRRTAFSFKDSESPVWRFKKAPQETTIQQGEPIGFQLQHPG